MKYELIFTGTNEAQQNFFDSNIYILTAVPENKKELISIMKEITTQKYKNSWLSKISDEIDYESFSIRIDETVEMIQKIINKNENVVGVNCEMAEYLVSMIAMLTLEDRLKHQRVILPELIKDKKSGNPGFDFLTICADDNIVFGEAKYKNGSSHYIAALQQVEKFLALKKTNRDVTEIRSFLPEKSIINFREKSYKIAIGFSNISKDEQLIKKLSKHPSVNSILSKTSIKALFCVGVKLRGIGD
ncbi:hypothetical protein [Culicoidibacter larvae]|uniref:DUF1837 domain-containing protein n=1 Tax=Culicoidibacter larvae TaxID=2579976 RepID=A0A5R8QI47_9FIRM|nr:hypothetical protein [Culicoidibacter larvae]TLG77396.1 hypothetical protein FEZ08_01895 [Culicoidibacter larvae]